MDIQLNISLNEALYLRNPQESETGRSILLEGARLMQELGFEDFTFRKLAARIGCTEANIYHYFRNKHRLLLYFVDLYWSWMDQQLFLMSLEKKKPVQVLDQALMLLTTFPAHVLQPGSVPAEVLRGIVLAEGHKSFLTKHVDSDNTLSLFKPYKDLCKRLVQILNALRPEYPFAHSLATTVLEMSHSLNFYKDHLPSLTDFGKAPTGAPVHTFLLDLCCKTLTIPAPRAQRG